MSLMNTFAPRADESGFGYYRRLAAENSLWGWKELAGMVGIRRDRSALMDSPTLVSDVLGIDSSWTATAVEREKQVRSWRSLRRLTADAFCPSCLKESAYIRQFWEHGYVTCCPRHNVRLVDQCDGCNKPIAKSREYLAYCPCGHDLTESQTSVPTQAERWLSTLILSNGRSSNEMLPRVRAVSLTKLCTLIRDLCLFIDPDVPPSSRKVGTVSRVSPAVELLAPLDELLSDWPLRFEDHVSARVRAGKQNARTINSLLGAWYIQLRKLSLGSDLEQFLTVVIRIATRDFEGIRSLDSAAQLVEDQVEHLRLSAAAKLIGVTQAVLHNAVMKSICQYRSRLLGTRGVTYEIPLTETQRIAQERARWITRKDAMVRAGVGEVVLQSMISAEVINSDIQWRIDIMKAGEIEAQSIDDLHATLIANLKPAQTWEGKEIILWSEIVSRRWGSNSAIQNTMQAAKKGELVPVVRGPTLGKMGFLKSDITRYFGIPALEAGMSVTNLEKITSWKAETIMHWIREGLLQCEEVNLPGQQRYVIRPEHLLAFGRNYITLSDLGKIMGTKSSAAARNFKGKVEFVGSLPLPNGQRRGGLVRIADLARLARSACADKETEIAEH